jgi:molecular chaperone GrpE (heat shock protein)
MEQLECIEKPFEQKALIDAVKSAMAKARVKHSAAAQPQPVAAPAAAKAPAGDEVAALKAEIRALNEKTAKMQAEFDNLKKQMNQIMAFVKQRLN